MDVEIYMLDKEGTSLSSDSPHLGEGGTIQSPEGGGGLEYFGNKYFETLFS